MDITWFNKNFRFVYTPNLTTSDMILNSLIWGINYKRFLVGSGSLSYWIGKKNSETVLKTAEKMKTDKSTVKFRKYGKIEIYVK